MRFNKASSSVSWRNAHFQAIPCSFNGVCRHTSVRVREIKALIDRLMFDVKSFRDALIASPAVRAYDGTRKHMSLQDGSQCDSSAVFNRNNKGFASRGLFHTTDHLDTFSPVLTVVLALAQFGFVNNAGTANARVIFVQVTSDELTEIKEEVGDRVL